VLPRRRPSLPIRFCLWPSLPLLSATAWTAEYVSGPGFLEPDLGTNCGAKSESATLLWCARTLNSRLFPPQRCRGFPAHRDIATHKPPPPAHRAQCGGDHENAGSDDESEALDDHCALLRNRTVGWRVAPPQRGAVGPAGYSSSLIAARISGRTVIERYIRKPEAACAGAHRAARCQTRQ
jgi:hypothetical protein